MFSFANRGPPQPSVVTLADARIVSLTQDDRLEKLLLGPIEVDFVPFESIPNYLHQGFVSKLEPNLQKWTDHGNSIISLRKDKKLFLAEVQYVPETNRFFPPKY